MSFQIWHSLVVYRYEFKAIIPQCAITWTTCMAATRRMRGLLQDEYVRPVFCNDHQSVAQHSAIALLFCSESLQGIPAKCLSCR
ncbi:hypothetical protein Y032_0072g657 [Ancylostoma ceylanicum]|uniref:Uncharacterized protein n=1 Tax=Ancylostoma ceylanicum TaxID=53326 RepID=A0A016TVJ5_9BILA|nr:hypothetical protein Y032_0072g657 [Ancylostoma ceylanicum]